MCLVWALRGARTWRCSSLVLPAVLVLGVTVLSIALAVNKVEALLTISRQATMIVFFLAVVHNLEVRPLRDWLEPVVLVCAALSVVGILQYVGWAFLSIPTAGMPSATFGYRNYGAIYAAMCAPIAAALVLTGTRRLGADLWSACLALIVAYLLVTRTRSSWAGLTGGLLGASLLALFGARNGARALWPPRDRVWRVAGAVAVAAIFGATVPPAAGPAAAATQDPLKLTVANTVASVFEPGGDKGRLTIWKNTLEMIAQQPLGVGAGNWKFIYPIYDQGEINTPTDAGCRPHNDYLWIASELGLPGFLLMGWLVLSACLLSTREVRAAASITGRWLTPGLLAALLAILGDAAFSFPSERIEPSFLTWLILGALAFAAWRDRDSVVVTALGTHFVPVLAAAVLLLAALSSWRANDFDAALARASAATDREDWPRVQSESSAALAVGVYDVQAYLLRGLARYVLKDPRGAVEDNLACLRTHPHFVNALNNLSMAYNALGRHDSALVHTARIFEINPRHVEAHANRALAFRGLKRYDDALAEFDRGLAKDAGRRVLVYEKGVTLETAGRLADAEAVYAGLVRRDTTDAAALYRLGAVQLRQGRPVEAIAALRNTLAANPAYLPAHYALGECFEALRDTSRAIEAYEAFLSRWKGAPAAAETVRHRIGSLGGQL